MIILLASKNSAMLSHAQHTSLCPNCLRENEKKHRIHTSILICKLNTGRYYVLGDFHYSY